MATFQDGLKDYVDVAERISIFREKYPTGCLQPANLEQPILTYLLDGKNYIMYTACAYRTPDDPRPGVGVAWELVPGATSFTRGSEVMNAETAAWGRAIVAVLAADTSAYFSISTLFLDKSTRVVARSNLSFAAITFVNVVVMTL